MGDVVLHLPQYQILASRFSVGSNMDLKKQEESDSRKTGESAEKS